MKSLKGTFIKGLSAVALLSAVACSEDRLDLQPYAQASSDIIYSDEELVTQALMGMYNAAQVGDYGGARRGYPFGAAYHQQNDMRGEDMVNTQAFYQFTYESTYNAASSLNNIYYWEDTYRLINRTNLLLEGLEKALANGVITQEVRNQYRGEALFFRAISHFELLKHFSRPYHISGGFHHEYGVPYVTSASEDLVSYLNNFNNGSDRETVSATYAKVLADLDEAEILMGSKSSVYRASKEAAIAYKTIVKLHKRDWAGVITEANKLDGVFSLESSLNNVFGSGATNNTESIFSLENSATNNPTVNGALASQAVGRSLIAISPILWNDPAWLEDDKRRAEGELIYVNGSFRTTYKYKDTTNFTDASPIVRYAEVLLNRAEAKARIGDATYLDDLNAVRNRSLADAGTQAYTSSSFTSQKEQVEAILKERRIEFVGEGKRWGDIHRLIQDDLAPTSGIPAKRANGTPAATEYVIGKPYVIAESDLQEIGYADKRFLWPIPTSTTSINPTLAAQQNEGW